VGEWSAAELHRLDERPVPLVELRRAHQHHQHRREAAEARGSQALQLLEAPARVEAVVQHHRRGERQLNVDAHHEADVRQRHAGPQVRLAGFGRRRQACREELGERFIAAES
jgi:hypothetical protein